MASDEYLDEITECERFLEFYDAVMSGTHPRVKIYPELVSFILLPSPLKSRYSRAVVNIYSR